MALAAVNGSWCTLVDPESDPSLRSDAESSKDISSDSESMSEFEAEDLPSVLSEPGPMLVWDRICEIVLASIVMRLSSEVGLFDRFRLAPAKATAWWYCSIVLLVAVASCKLDSLPEEKRSGDVTCATMP